MKADFVARCVHVPTWFNTGAETRPRMYREQRIWLAAKRMAAVLAGDLNAKRPLDDGSRTAPSTVLLGRHHVDHIYGNNEWEVLDAQTVNLTRKGLSDHDAVRVTLRHKRTDEVVVVATVNLKHHWQRAAYRALRIIELLDADVVLCQEADEAQSRAFATLKGHRTYRGFSNSLRRRGGWIGNLIVWRSSRVIDVRRRSRPTFYIYLKGKKRSRRPRVPVPAVSWSPIVWFAFRPERRD